MFDYCSPECRNSNLLAEERKRLQEDLKSFEDNRKLSSSAVSKKHKPTLQGSAHAGDSDIKPTCNTQLNSAYGLDAGGSRSKSQSDSLSKS